MDEFLVACTRLYNPLCPSVGPSVGPSIGNTLLFWQLQTVWGLQHLPNCLAGLFHHCPFPPARDLGNPCNLWELLSICLFISRSVHLWVCNAWSKNCTNAFFPLRCVRLCVCVWVCACLYVFLHISANVILVFIDHRLSGSKTNENEKKWCEDGKIVQIFIENYAYWSHSLLGVGN